MSIKGYWNDHGHIIMFILGFLLLLFIFIKKRNDTGSYNNYIYEKNGISMSPSEVLFDTILSQISMMISGTSKRKYRTKERSAEYKICRQF